MDLHSIWCISVYNCSAILSNSFCRILRNGQRKFWCKLFSICQEHFFFLTLLHVKWEFINVHRDEELEIAQNQAFQTKIQLKNSLKQLMLAATSFIFLAYVAITYYFKSYYIENRFRMTAIMHKSQYTNQKCVRNQIFQ